ncbi:MAG TPA: alginate lyase family protein [Terriglobales bacterium]|jgi:hypothetical protein
MPDKAIRQRWQRLQGMTHREILSRSKLELVKRTDEFLSRLGYDFSGHVGIREGQVAAARFFFTTEEIPSIIATLAAMLPQEKQDIVVRANRICEHRFDLLGFDTLDFGAQIDWHLDPVHEKRAPREIFHKVPFLDFEQCGDVKIPWELNRHQHFVTLAKAYRITGDEKFATEVFAQWKHWHRENPYAVGLNWASSLEIAFRSLSWFWAYYLLAGSPNTPAGFDAEFLRAQALNGRHIERYLSTYFSPNTHLVGEAVALFFLGTLLPQLKDAKRWQTMGWRIVLAEAGNQIRDDGMHFEQSTYYHVYALDFFLHAAVLASLNEISIPPELEATIQKMLDALALLGQRGNVPRFGDDDGGRVFDGSRNRAEHLLDPLATGAVLFGRGDYKALSAGLREENIWLLGMQGVAEFEQLEYKPVERKSAALASSGLHIMEAVNARLVIDAGPHGSGSGGHGHADALSLSISDHQGPLLIDPGTLEYVGPGIGRNQHRGTPAHNTVAVDDKDQADATGPFSWSSLPSVEAEKWISGENFDLFVGSHDGYRRLENPVVHRRYVFGLKSEFFLVRDVLAGEGQHRADVFWHFAPELRLADKRCESFLDQRRERGVLALAVRGHGWAQDVRQGSWSPVYGKAERATVLHFGTSTTFPVEFATLLVPVVRARINIGELTVAAGASTKSSVRGYRYTNSQREHYAYFAGGQHWSAGSWTSDAEFLYWGTNTQGNDRLLIFCNGSYVEMNGKRMVSCTKSITRCELRISEDGVKLFSSDDDAVELESSLNGTSPREADSASVPDLRGKSN